ncbi:hypothetical protein B0H19DRAFT_1138144 [Mycena capillaripes]|nr:hypothetical protein B0H19DRAFT_1138144 [Mycena capillaripes]
MAPKPVPFSASTTFLFSLFLSFMYTTPSTSPTMGSESNAVPPTTHAMPHTNRLRIMRSMRKLTAVLGETPVVEMPSPAPHLLAPSDTGKRGFFFHASASLSSLALPFQKSETSHVAEGRPSLVLRLPDTFEPLPAPLSPSFSPTLMSPSTPPPEQERRRQRLAKVTRTLGENVPPNLIISSPDIKRRRRASTLILPESALEQQTFALAAADGQIDRETTRHSRRLSVNGGARVLKRAISFIALRTDVPVETDADADDAASPLGEVHVHPAVAFSPDALLSPAEWLSSAPRSERDVDAAHVEPNVGAPPTYDESHQHGPARPTSRAYTISDLRSAKPEEMQRHEDEWSGEWGGAAGNMDDVMRRLRGLKAK